MPTLTPTQMHALGDLWADNTSREFDAILALADALGFERAKTILSAFTTNAAPSPPTTALIDAPADAFTFEAQGDQTVIYAEADDTCTALVVIAFGDETFEEHQARVRVIIDAMNAAAAGST